MAEGRGSFWELRQRLLIAVDEGNSGAIDQLHNRYPTEDIHAAARYLSRKDYARIMGPGVGHAVTGRILPNGQSVIERIKEGKTLREIDEPEATPSVMFNNYGNVAQFNAGDGTMNFTIQLNAQQKQQLVDVLREAGEDELADDVEQGNDSEGIMPRILRVARKLTQETLTGASSGLAVQLFSSMFGL